MRGFFYFTDFKQGEAKSISHQENWTEHIYIDVLNFDGKSMHFCTVWALLL